MPSAISIAFPPAPTFTETSLPSLAGKVYIVTGAASGVGFELAKIIYNAGGTVYIAARSTSRCNGAIEKIEAQGKPQNKGKLGGIVIDLADLGTVKGAVESFLKRESRLDVLFHNAGVMTPPKGSKDKSGHDLEMGTNCIGPYLLTLFLEPLLVKTAALSPQYGVRIVWVSSIVQVSAPPGAMSFDENGTPKILKNKMDNYMHSKVGACWLAAEFSNRLGSKGILSVSLHPGFMKTELQRNFAPGMARLMGIIFKPPIYGAYSELFCGFSSDLTAENNGGFMTAWGRVAEMPKEIAKGMPDKEGGRGKRFIEYCDRETAGYK